MTIKKLMKKLYGIRSRCKHFYYYKKNGIQCLLTIQELTALWQYFEADKMKKPEIDRINSLGNYEINNCQILEKEEHQRKDANIKILLSKPKNRCRFCGLPTNKKFCLPEHYRSWMKRTCKIRQFVKKIPLDIQ